MKILTSRLFKKLSFKFLLKILGTFHLAKNRKLSFFTFSYLVKKLSFLCKIFEIMILMDLYALRISEFENHISRASSLSLSLCVYVCVCVCVSVISITQKQITAETSNLIFYICTDRCYLKLFIKI